MSNYSTNDTPVGVGYNSDGEARAFVELSAVSVGSISSTSVSADEYYGLPAGSLPGGASDGDLLTYDGGTIWQNPTSIPSLTIPEKISRNLRNTSKFFIEGSRDGS